MKIWSSTRLGKDIQNHILIENHFPISREIEAIGSKYSEIESISQIHVA